MPGRCTVVLFLALVTAPGGIGSAAGQSTPARPPLRITPPAIDLGRVTGHTEGVFRLAVINRTDETIRLTYLFAECDCSFEMPDAAEVPGAGEIVLEVKYDMEKAGEGHWEESITILTDHYRQPEIIVPVTAWVQGRREPRGMRPDGG